MIVRIRVFAGLREAIGRGEIDVELPDGASAGAAIDHLAESFAAVADYRSRLLLARNHEYVDADAPLADGDELGVFPPVSGG